MFRNHLVRVGTIGSVGRFPAVDSSSYPRGTQVIVRTRRGLEIGEVLAPPEAELGSHRCDGSILRPMTTEDHLLQSRIKKNQNDAFAKCVELLNEKNVPASLIEVEHLFDGKGLYFYFLGEVDGRLESLTSALADVYDQEVQFRSFTETLLAGCGPECGTEEGSCGSCGSDSEEGCGAASACKTIHDQV